MGVPKFFRWLSERYPKIIQRYGSPPAAETVQTHYGAYRLPPDYLPPPDPLSTCTLPPVIHRLYLDMNGIIHCCSHNNNNSSSSSNNGSSETPQDGVNQITEAEIFQNVCYYLDRIVSDIAKPTELVYLAIDGVAPRAKLNQQRARRYRSGKEGEIEQTVYDAHRQALEREREREEQEMLQAQGDDDSEDVDIILEDADSFYLDRDNNKTNSKGGEGRIKEVEPGRFTGKFETDEADSQTPIASSSSATANTAAGLHDMTADPTDEDILFHSNAITPGTAFLTRCTAHIEHFLQRKISTDWQHLTIIFSGPNVPGEGEHKILQFIREQQSLPVYNPNLRHCIYGQDGDLIMLGLATHEPNLVLLREQVLFGKKSRRADALAEQYGLNVYLHNANFEFLHMNVLRDYLAYEFETTSSTRATTTTTTTTTNNSTANPIAAKTPAAPPTFCLEHTVDDFVFMTFFVGNDFLPHMPALDIADEAFDLIFYTYRSLRQQWWDEYQQNPTVPPYLTAAGEIVSGKRLENFTSVLGAHENYYYDYKREAEKPEDLRKMEKKFGMDLTPSDEVLTLKEESDRARFRKMIQSSIQNHQQQQQQDHAQQQQQQQSGNADFVPVLTNQLEVQDVVARMGNLLKYSVSEDVKTSISDQDLKGRYYYDKFGISPFDADKHVALRKAYLQGLVWNLKYYYEGCVSWDWYYPYHYGPMLSDLVGLDEYLPEVSFDKKPKGQPLKPFEQLLACLPPSHADLLPEPFRPLMTEADSPVSEFYPRSFTVDMNGKRWPWEAVVLLPFIDSKRLLEAAHTVDSSTLTEEEIERNKLGEAVVLTHDLINPGRVLEPVGEGEAFGMFQECRAASQLFPSSPWHYVGEQTPLFRPELKPGVVAPLDGLPTLRDGLIKSVWRKLLRINVHGVKSRYKTSCLELENRMPDFLPVDVLAQQLIGTTVYINYPHMIESFVTAVSNATVVVRGNTQIRPWTHPEAESRKQRVGRIVGNYTFGEHLPGTGGISFLSGVGEDEPIETMETLLNVRPFAGLQTLPDGTVGKKFAKFEVEVPLFVTSWAPVRLDERLRAAPMLLELDPYHAAKGVLTDKIPSGLEDEKPTSSPRLKRTFKYGFRRPRLMSATREFHTYAGKPAVALEFDSRSPCAITMGSTSYMQAIYQASFNGAHVQRTCMEKVNVTRLKPAPRSFSYAKTSSTRLSSIRGRVVAVGILSALSFFSGCKAVDMHGAPFREAIMFRSPFGPRSFELGLVDDDADGAADGPLSPRPVAPIQIAHGTTTLSFCFQGGIVAAVDSRATLGSFVGSKTTQKVLPVNTHIVGTMAGGAADCSFWIRQLAEEASLHELSHGRRMSVARASRLLSNALYDNRGLGLSMGTMIMGFDDYNDDQSDDDCHQCPPRIFYVDNTGMRVEGDVFAVGSGSTFALGILDTERRFDMTVDEAVSLGIKAIRHATFRDAYSGGFINVFLLTRKDGWRRVYSEDLARLSKDRDGGVE